MAESIGYSTLDIIPSFKGLQQKLDAGVGPAMSRTGTAAGKRFGDSAGKSAVTSLRGHLSAQAKSIAAPIIGAFAGFQAVEFIKGSFAEAREAATIGRQTAAALKATGEAANVSASQVGDLASALSKKVGVDDEAIQSGENLLLTFRNIKNEVGTGNDIFNQATAAVLDMSTAMGQDLRSSAVQVGKALNDPVRGMTALQRTGVTFTQSQKDQVKALVESGRALDAQKIILAELNSEFAGAAEAGHDATDRLGVAFGNMQEALGTELMPLLDGFATVTTTKVIPAVGDVGNAVGDLAAAFGALPAPIKAGAAALATLKVAQAIGVTSSLTSGVKALGSAWDGTRLRVMVGADAYNATRSAADGAAAANSRLAASFAAVRAGSVGAGNGIKAGLGGALRLVGGPWGAAFIAGTAIVAHFWKEQQEAKARIQAVTDALDQQTGAMTDNSKQALIKALQDEGILDTANKLGLSLDLVTRAAAGEAGAQESLVAARERAIKSAADALAAGDADTHQKQEQARGIRDLVAEIFTESDAIDDERRRIEQRNEAAGESHNENVRGVRTYRSLADQVDRTEHSVIKLWQAENKRRLSNLQDRRDEIALRETIRATREEANKGRDALFDNSKAADVNMSALLDLADQWNQSSSKVRNARGAYDRMRGTFIDLAEDMGASEDKAEGLAKQLLTVPKKLAFTTETPGLDKALAKLARLRGEQALIQGNKLRVRVGADQALASGGLVGGTGTPTSDSNLAWLSRGEYVQRARAVDYYGLDFMHRLNALQIPKRAGGGTVDAPASAPRASVSGGTAITIGTVVAHDYDDFMAQMQQRRIRRAYGGVPIGRR